MRIAVLLLAASAAAQAPTYCKDVAPILFRHCATCHRPGESAPFSLLTYADARRKQRQIVKVTKARIMPPWLPDAGHERLVGARRLSKGELETLAKWAEAGAPEGDPTHLPKRPEFPKGWQLREPDLVVTLPEAFEVPAGGPDLFRNFVLPVRTERLRYVEAVEIRPDSPAVHHAILQVDRSRQTRALAGPDLQFAGMSLGYARPPDGHFLGWTPGKTTQVAPPDMAWRLHPGSDLVLQLHITPTGKKESIRPRIGLFFRDRAPQRFPYAVVLYSESIDIPAGKADYVVRDRFELPVPVELFGVYPHAHYVCRKMHGYAVLPGGERRTLIRIGNWDFDWQDDYRFAKPIALPAGTVLHMEYVYDNSEANPSNPHDPPRRVKFGEQSQDEMGTMTFLVVPRSAEDRLRLRERSWRLSLVKKPDDPDAHFKLALVLREQGRMRDAVASLQNALKRNPKFAPALCELGSCLETIQRYDAALQLYDGALKIDAKDYVARLGRGRALLGKGDTRGAERELRRALALLPDLVDARVLLGNILARRGDTREAIAHFRRALRARPGTPEVHNNLATALFSERKLADAEREYRAALALRADYFNARFNLGRVLLARGKTQQARIELERAARLQPDNPAVRAALERLRR